MSLISPLMPDAMRPVPSVPAPGVPASGVPAPPPADPGGGVDPAVMAAAREFEAVFLAEMLRYTGLADVPDGFGGGIGEQRFASLVIDEYARAISSTRSFGLAERIYGALMERAGA